MKSFQQYILEEMPQHYPSSTISYQKDEKFIPISKRNIQNYIKLGNIDGFLFMVDQDNMFGFVFDMKDLINDNNKVLPVMRLSLRDTNINGYKQAHFLRIRKSYAQNNLTSTFYDLYVDKFGGIVSDFEHLEGGKTLWKSLIKNASNSLERNISLINNKTGEVINKDITNLTDEDTIWSKDSSLKDIVLVYTKI